MVKTYEIIFESFGTPRLYERNYHIMDGHKCIGTIEGLVNQYGQFTSVLIIYPEYQKMNNGFTAFRKVYEELNEKIPIVSIMGNWYQHDEFKDCQDGMSTNLRLFSLCFAAGGDANQCAANTPTGKWAAKLGFDKCKVLAISHTEVNVMFTKENIIQ